MRATFGWVSHRSLPVALQMNYYRQIMFLPWARGRRQAGGCDWPLPFPKVALSAFSFHGVPVGKGVSGGGGKG